jgi:hypothetical protein
VGLARWWKRYGYPASESRGRANNHKSRRACRFQLPQPAARALRTLPVVEAKTSPARADEAPNSGSVDAMNPERQMVEPPADLRLLRTRPEAVCAEAPECARSLVPRERVVWVLRADQ